MKIGRLVALVSLLAFLSVLMLSTRLTQAYKAGAHARPKRPQDNRARLSDRVSMPTAGRGNPWINLEDGRDLLTAYDNERFVELASKGATHPLSLASADFDEDGVPDLISGYGGNSGTITIHRGNVDSIYPNGHEAKQRQANGDHSDSPFLSPALVFDVPEPPDFIAAGDFDGDSHWDVATAKRGGSVLYLLSGDGRGRFRQAQLFALPGYVTAMVCGDINRRDGLSDLVVAISGEQGPQALAYESPEGALRDKDPEVIALAAEAEALCIGQLDEKYEYDLAIGAGNELLIVQGRDRKLSLDETRRAEVVAPRIEHLALPAKTKALSIGNFAGDHRVEIALLDEDGRAQVASRKNKKWSLSSFAAERFGSTSQLISAKVSSLPHDDLLVVDEQNRQVQILIARHPSESLDRHLTSSSFEPRQAVMLDVEGAPIAVLPMRLNGDALNDLVILKEGAGTLAIASSAPLLDFAVSNTNDSGAGSLRQAIINANNNAGLDSISFSISGGGVKTITPLSALPMISSPVIIDGYTQSGSSPNTLANGDNAVLLIELSGINIPAFVAGLTITTGNSTVKGLVINRFTEHGILSNTSGGNIIEGNFIGTNATGTTDLGNAGSGVSILTIGNTIGGTVAPARNIISGNDGGVSLFDSSAVSNQVQGNFIGTDVNGTADLGNTFSGMNIVQSPSNVIGGLSTAARNIISGNDVNGVIISGSAATGNQLLGNFIGTDVNGLAALGNLGNGIFIMDNSGSGMIGGTAAGAGNRIAFNGARGIRLNSGTGTSILSNLVHSNTLLGIDIVPIGVNPNDAGDADTGPNNLQNFPVLTSASTTAVQGTLNSTATTNFRIEFFSNPTCDSSGNGEGQTFVGATNVVTNGSGNVSFSFTFSSAVALGHVITATATDSSNNTSEFSQCVVVTTSTPTHPDTMGLYNPTASTYFLRNSNSTGVADLQFGYGPAGAGWIALAGDWNADGIDTVGLYNPTAGTFFLRNSNSTGIADISFSYGPAGAGWLPIVGDWNSDGMDTIGLYNPAASTFFLRNTNTAGVADLSFSYGPAGAGWLPIAGDWNADGVDTIGLYNPTASTFFLRNTNSTGVADLSFAYGPAGAGWKPVVGDWNGDGVDTIGLYNPTTSAFFLRNSNSTGVADVSFAYGPAGAGWTPLVGDWDGL